MSDVVEFVLHNALLFIALFAIAGLLVGGELLRRLRGISAVDAAGALRLINDQQATVLDVRDSSEYNAGHIPQARHIPLNTLSAQLSTLDKGKPILAYCLRGMRSQSACALLKKQGFTRVYTLTGGFPAWLEAKLPVENASS